MIILYLVLILSIGINFFVILEHFGVIDIRKLNLFEIASFIITNGFILFTLYMFIIGIFGIKYEFYIFVPIIICSIFSLLYIIKLLIKFQKYFKKMSFKIQKEKIFNIIIYLVLIFTNLNILVFFSTKSLTTKFVYPDEFSVWGLNAKNIFLGRKLDFFMNTGLENYPNFLPLLYSGLYIFIGRIQENLPRIFSSVFLIINLINLLGIAKRLNLDYKYVLFGNLFISTYFTESRAYATSLYSEYSFMAMYTMAIEYLILFILSHEKAERKNFLCISILNMIGSCWCRQDGLYLFAFNIFTLLIILFINKNIKVEKITLREFIFYISTVLIVPITWKIWTIIANYPKELAFGAGSKFELHLEFLVPLFQNMTQQFFNDIPSVILLGLLILGMFFYFERLEQQEKIIVIYNLLACLANIAFLIICYLFVFGGEAIVAASFIRYCSRIIMIQFISILILFKPIENRRITKI